MLLYPSISRSTGTSFQKFQAYVFDKIDGSNLRFEWRRKKGWCLCGTRTRLFDETDLDFGESVDLFQLTMAEKLEKIFRKKRWDKFTVFCEFWGEQSFAGVHQVGDPKFLTLFDVSVDKHGFLDPRTFLKIFGDLPTPNFLGIHNWTRFFVDQIRLNQIEGVTFEGVVGKSGGGNRVIRAKAKTQQWIDKVKSLYPTHEDLSK